MKYQFVILVVALVFVCVESKPAGGEESKILKYDSDVREDGYSFAFETNDPITRNEEGVIVPGSSQAQGRSAEEGEDNSNLQVKGDFGFNFPDGIPFHVEFVADENGYRPKVSFGTHA
ncbi:unnamed protein product [Phyllotreta striolata]|uniref:Uncharacterized protein n=1 Tax=Phyllotreta striolata TaxID=444603 RepID=A0A9N9TLU0_PHYSR|nr:unnamed protein product [Phyllotreta striolata]